MSKFLILFLLFSITKSEDSIKTGKNPYITGTGRQRRDMAYLDDVVSANIFAMNHKDRFDGRNFDVGTGENISLNEIKEIALTHNPNVKFEYVEERVGDVMYTKANIEPLTSLGWEPKVSILKGMHRCFGGAE